MTASTAAAQPLLAALADFGASLSLEAAPAEVRHQAKLCVLDTLGCMLAGADTEEGAMFLRAELQGLGSAAGVELSPVAQARLHGYWGDIFELNDLVGGHASIGNVATALAVARSQGSDGAFLLRAVIAGIEITSRISESQLRDKKPYGDCGMVAVGMQSAVGAAAAAAVLAGLSPQDFAQALAISGAISNWCPAEVIFGDGGTIKPILFGACPADAGIRAVAYARQGLTGPPRLLESPIGWFATVAHRFDDELLRDNTRWHLLAPQRKLHACCGFTHSAIDVVSRMRQRGVDVAGAQRIEIGVPRYIIPAISKTRPPTSANEARFHLEYCAALAAHGVDVILPAHSIDFASQMAKPALCHTLQRMSVHAIELPPGAKGNPFNFCEVTVVGPDGQVFKDAGHAPRGSLGNPLDDTQLFEKFRALTRTRVAPETIETCIERTMNLEQQRDAQWIFELLDSARRWRQ